MKLNKRKCVYIYEFKEKKKKLMGKEYFLMGKNQLFIFASLSY
jgi:hypothetical protein